MRSMHNASGFRFALAGSGLLCVADAADANAGLPMLYVVWPTAWLLFFPVVVAEALLACKIFSVSWRKGATISIVANILTTLVGVPIVWGMLLIVSLLGGQGGGEMPLHVFLFWIPPAIPSEFAYIVPLFSAVFCLPMMAVTMVIEWWVVSKWWRLDSSLAWQWAKVANLLTYACLITLYLGVSLWLYLSHS